MELTREIISWVVVPAERPLADQCMNPRQLWGGGRLSYPNFEDVSNVALACPIFKSIVKELSSARLVIRTRQELRMYGCFFADQRTGRRAISIDFRVPPPYDPHELSSLLRFTPNLITFIHNPFGREKYVGTIAKTLVIALATQLPMLQVLILLSKAESPVFDDVVVLMNSIKTLTTLHVECIHSYPELSSYMSAPLKSDITSTISTLSLGVLQYPSLSSSPSYAPVWDKFVTLLTHQNIRLDLLNALIIPMFPAIPAFFDRYGPQLQSLSTTSFFSQYVLAPALKSCPNLEELTINLCDEVPGFPSALPKVKTLRIHPCVDDLCGTINMGLIHSCPLRLNEIMDQLYSVDLPEAKTLTIFTVASFTDLNSHRAWMSNWRTQWLHRGVRLTDHCNSDLGRYD
ncbi:hypothetical protein MD484_g7243, partial [Candolleomyces efflorescens]